MRIALAAEGTRGDIHPLLALGVALRADGHEPVLCAPPDFASAALEHGIEHRVVGQSVVDYLTREARVLHGGGIAMLRNTERYGREILAAQFAALPDAVRDADLVLGAGIALAARSAAEIHDVPYRFVAYCPSVLPSSGHSPAFLPMQTDRRWANGAAWRLLRAGFNMSSRRTLNAHRAQIGLPPVRDLMSHFLGDRPILAADRALAPLPGDLAFAVDRVSCLLPIDEDAPLPDKLESFLAAGPPPVYFGFGSMTDPDPAMTTECLLDAIARLGCRAVLGRGWAGLGDGPLSEGVMAIGAVSHARLFPRMAAVVHHGGAGTTTTTSRAGVPQVVIPHVLDQFYWARRVSDLGLGPPAVPRRHLNARTLAETVSQVIDNEILAERAQEFGARLRAERVCDAEMVRVVLHGDHEDERAA